ncbi:alpha/beta hydrolase family protein [Cohnella abietis]|uniref:Acetyl xylan esterase domain-containing protein n=1 Tax=Cohnella abietis TaxID=2507935 RepID=A0A3T1CYH8_9BACL|nr:acetylxylan esterase [Cohnella abietis]BBI30829.1 hypothetical protein KCTCHS21_02280 [Cohnella abietis]
MEQLYETPVVYPVSEDDHTGIKALFYRGVPYQGKETRVFAYVGVPQHASLERKVPAIVLVHGGAGTAFSEWVRLWMDRGYAAIAMDLEGQVPFQLKEQEGTTEWPSHSWSGPVKQGVFADYRMPVEDQWMYHAVSAAVLAHSLIRSIPGVDKSQIGMTGISWGGIITSLVAGLDKRLSYAMPIYGCGFLYEPGTGYGLGFAAMPPTEADRFRLLWDPSTYLPESHLPMLWLNGSNDSHFPLSIFIKSYELNKNCNPNSRLSLHHGLGHSYSDAWACEEPYAFADSVTKGNPSFVDIMEVDQQRDWVGVRYASSIPVEKAILYWCRDDSDWRTARWEPIPAQLDEIEGSFTASACLPESGGTFFMNLINDRGWTTSTRVMTDNRKTSILHDAT